ncbi:hypothetical protein BRADI_2g12343v3 [Brachypodium distachyon]|uniref:Uncharacterized protein n=1 Tax=Brachypodium distachyon TaxID=15368 RepID=A0A2K2D847_BRADI|nr:hypothetical protein BRADI_2g12343v3 [Brachypodium distachyon]
MRAGRCGRRGGAAARRRAAARSNSSSQFCRGGADGAEEEITVSVVSPVAANVQEEPAVLGPASISFLVVVVVLPNPTASIPKGRQVLLVHQSGSTAADLQALLVPSLDTGNVHDEP